MTSVDDPLTRLADAAGSDPPPRPATVPGLPLRPGLARLLVLLAVFLCAACGLVYELALVALGSQLLGDPVLQASLVLAVMVFAMGLGSLAAKPLQSWPVTAFVLVECLLALLGGVCVLGLYAVFAWYGPSQLVLVLVALAVGFLIGTEIPLLMTLLQQIRRQDAGSAAADLFAADYVGALIGGLVFPFLLLPVLGQSRGALATGAVNVVAGAAVVLWLFRRALSRTALTALACVAALVLAALGTAFSTTSRFEAMARHALYGETVLLVDRTGEQELVLTRAGSADNPLSLHVDGGLLFSTATERRLHEALVHPVMGGRHRSVLVIDSGDGLALREVLRYRGVTRAVQLGVNPAVARLAATQPDLARLNAHALTDPRVRSVAGDPLTWLRGRGDRFDLVVVDLPDPTDVAGAKLYSREFYGLVRRVLAPGGRLVVRTVAPAVAPAAFWSVDASLRLAGLRAGRYALDLPGLGQQAFLLAAERPLAPRLVRGAPVPRWLTPAVLRAARTRVPTNPPRSALPSTLLQPRILEYLRDGY